MLPIVSTQLTVRCKQRLCVEGRTFTYCIVEFIFCDSNEDMSNWQSYHNHFVLLKTKILQISTPKIKEKA